MTTAAISFEWTKVRTLRSTVWFSILYVAIGTTIGILSGYYISGRYSSPAEAAADNLDPVAVGFSGIHLALLVLVVFAVLAMTSEYSTGIVRSSLMAVPQRGVFYRAKLLTVSAAVFILSLVAVFGSFFATQAVMGGYGVSLGDEGVLRALVNGSLYVTLLCAFSMGLAAVLRSAALTIGILAPLFLTLSTILTNIPGVGEVARFLPDQAGQRMMLRGDVAETGLSPGIGFLVLLAWTAASVSAGYWAVAKRDV